MGYNPGITYQGDRYIAGAGQNLANDISTWLDRSRDEQKQKEFNVGVATQLQKSGQLSPEDLQDFLTLNTDKQGGILAGIARNTTEQRQQQQLDLEKSGQLQRGQIANMEDSRRRDEIEASTGRANIEADAQRDVAGIRRGGAGNNVAVPVTTTAGRKIPGHYMLGNQQITDQTEVAAAQADNWEKNRKAWKDATGATYAEWMNATNKRMDPTTGDIVADFPAQQIPDPQNPGKTINVPGTTRRVNGDIYSQLMDRATALQTSGGFAPAAGGTSPAAAVPFPDGTRVRRGKQWFVYRNGAPVAEAQ